VDEAAVRLAFLGYPWQYAYYAIDPQDRPSSPTERQENTKLNRTFHRPYRKEYDQASHTWKTIYTRQEDPVYKWVDPEDADKPQAAYSIAPGVRRRQAKVIHPDEGPRPGGTPCARKKAWSSNDVREDVWGGTEMGPRLPIDAAQSAGRNMFIDRSRHFAIIMQRLDELERLARITPIEGRELRALCMRENDELFVLHRSYEESVQDGIFGKNTSMQISVGPNSAHQLLFIFCAKTSQIVTSPLFTFS